jgi:pilus assembly protein CpaB
VNKRKTLAVVGALLLAIISTAALVKYVKGAKDRAVAGEELVEVLVAKDNIKAGTSAAELADKVQAEQVQAKVRAVGAITSFAQIDGLIAAIDIVPGEQLLAARFVNPSSFQGVRSSAVRLPEGANEVTFKLAPERALGGQIRPGDTVTVLASFAPFENEGLDKVTGDVKTLPKSPNTTHVILNGTVVVRIQFPDNANTSSKEKDGVGVAPGADLLVTLAVDQPSLERAVFAAEYGSVWLSYEPKSANSTKNKEVNRGNVFEPTESLLIAPTIPFADASVIVPSSTVPVAPAAVPPPTAAPRAGVATTTTKKV